MFVLRYCKRVPRSLIGAFATIKRCFPTVTWRQYLIVKTVSRSEDVIQSSYFAINVNSAQSTGVTLRSFRTGGNNRQRRCPINLVNSSGFLSPSVAGIELKIRPEKGSSRHSVGYFDGKRESRAKDRTKLREILSTKGTPSSFLLVRQLMPRDVCIDMKGAAKVYPARAPHLQTR